MESGPGENLSKTYFPDTLPPTPGGLLGKGLSRHFPTRPQPGLHAPRGPLAHLFGKISSSLPCPFPFPSEGHFKAEMEGLKEGPPGTLGLWLWPCPHPLHPSPPPPAHSSPAEVNPSGMGQLPPPSTSHITALHSLLFSSLPSRGEGRGLGVGPPSPLLLHSLGEG